MKQKILIECSACDGTGLYCGMAEPRGTAVVCLKCDGTGREELSYTPFERRKEKQNVHTVYRSKGAWLMSCGPAGKSVTYDEFKNGRMP